MFSGISGYNLYQSLSLADHAQKAGASCLVCATPLLHQLDEQRIFKFFEIINSNSSIPVMIQNMEGFSVNPIKIDTINNLISEFHNLKYIKEESSPSIIKIEQVITKCEGNAEAVFGGFGGAQLIDELELGSSGSLVASEFVDILVYTQLFSPISL